MLSILSALGAVLALQQAAVPVLVGPETISTGNVYRGTFTPDGDTLYFFRKTGAGETYRIFRAHRSGDSWTAGERVDLGGDYSDLYPTLSRDGRRLVFTSYRPAPGDTGKPQAYLWMTERTGARWGPARFLGATTRRGWYHSQPRIAADGTLEVYVQSPDYRDKVLLAAAPTATGFGPADTAAVWRTWTRDVPAGQHLYELAASPDRSYVVLLMGDRPNGAARPAPSDLWIARRRGTTEWGPPVRLPATINTAGIENFVFWSPSGRELYFIRDFATLFSVPAAALLPGG